VKTADRPPVVVVEKDRAVALLITQSEAPEIGHLRQNCADDVPTQDLLLGRDPLLVARGLLLLLRSCRRDRRLIQKALAALGKGLRSG
jgi:hypothetical protein